MRHGNVQYCFQCEEYPCRFYDGIDRYDSLISHRNQKRDLAKAEEMGIDAYLAEQSAKKAILDRLLKDYDDGRHDVFLCLAVNMLDVIDLQKILEEADESTGSMPQEEKADHMVSLLTACAKKGDIPLKLRH